MKAFAAAAIAIAMTTGLAIAQETSATSESGATDAATYLKGPKVNDLYTDESRTAVRPSAEKCERPGVVATMPGSLRDRLIGRTPHSGCGSRGSSPCPAVSVPSGATATMVHVR